MLNTKGAGPTVRSTAANPRWPRPALAHRRSAAALTMPKSRDSRNQSETEMLQHLTLSLRADNPGRISAISRVIFGPLRRQPNHTIRPDPSSATRSCRYSHESRASLRACPGAANFEPVPHNVGLVCRYGRPVCEYDQAPRGSAMMRRTTDPLRERHHDRAGRARRRHPLANGRWQRERAQSRIHPGARRMLAISRARSDEGGRADGTWSRVRSGRRSACAGRWRPRLCPPLRPADGGRIRATGDVLQTAGGRGERTRDRRRRDHHVGLRSADPRPW